jgi:hypothetical protein
MTKEQQIEKLKKEMLIRRNVLLVIPNIIDGFSNINDKDRFIDVCRKQNPQTIAEIAYYGKELMKFGLSKDEVLDILVVKTQ